MSDNHIDYLEQLFQGVDILIERKLKDVSYDTTIVCTIVDDSDSKNGKYQVTDGTIRFDVYSDSDKYKVKDQVRVSIAKGDYSDKKYIIGKYVADNNTQPLTYVSPLNTVVNITGNLVPTNKQNVGIIANKSDKPYIDIWSTSLANGRFADLQANGIYSAITLKADFKTLMHSYNVKSGTYGLRLTLLVKPSKNSAGYIAKTAELSSDEMFGNPYAFSISTEQTKVFDIGTEGLITNIALQLYQNNDFYDVNDVKIPVSLTENIIVNNIELGFGSDLTAIGDNTVKIYTESDSVYKYQGHSPAPYDRKLGYPNQLNAVTNQKTLGILWYNKNDLNEYVGFSDGLYDPDYDEIAYLDLAREDTRLTAHIGREGVPTDKESLELAANIEEGKPLIESAMKVVTQDLITMLRALHAQFEGIDDFTTEINNCITSLKGIATDNANSIKNTLTLLDTQYSKILEYGKKKQDNETPGSWESAWNVNNGEVIRDAFTAVRTTIQTLLEEKIAPRVAENGDYSGYASVYDTYKIRLNKVLTTMDEYLNENGKHRFPRTIFEGYSVTDEISGNTQTFTSDYTRLMRYNNQKTDWKSYLKKDLKEYENKYCIYWFRYEKDYISNEVHQFMPNGWRRLDTSWNEYSYSVPANIGIPGKGEQIDGKTYNEKRLPPGEGTFNIMMRYNEPEERFVAIIFHNHNMYKSDELVFRNADRIPEVANIETGDLLIFEHSQDGKSRNDYQCYNLTNYLMDSADASHNRKIKVHYDGLLNGDEALVGGGLYWYVPLTATMLTFDLNVLQDNGFVSDQKLVEGKPEYIDPKPEYSKEGYACFYKQVTAVKDEETGEYNFVNNKQIDSRDFWYKIKPYYDATAVINSIKCEFRPAEDNDIVTGEEFFSFGTMGSNGTKYTLAITPSTNQVATTPSTELKLDLSLRDFNNEEIPIIKGQIGDGSATGLETEWLYAYKGIKPAEILSSVEGQDRVIGLTAVANSCGIVKATVNFQLSSEGAQEESGNIPVTKKRTVRLETVRAIALAAGDYYISGPTSIIYNSLGTIDNKSMFDNPYKLYALKNLKVGDTEYKANQEIPVSWEYTYHKHNNPNWPDGETEQAEYDFYSRYMPVVNDAGGLTPAPMYLDGLDCYLMVHAYTGTATNKNYLYHQPVIITQNRFGSSVLNDWDGSLTIDEKNGTILSTMIGAGRKTIQNTFEGVLMGDVAVGTNSDTGFEQSNEIGIANHTGLGIYGFHDGAQSFGFNIDGTAFLGKAGRGRIIFNGNNGVIASSNWFLNGGKIRKGLPGENETWIESYGTDGMCIDLENGHIDSYNFKLTSKDIYLNSNPQDDPDYYFRIGHTETEEGDLPSSGLLTFDKYGHLILQADRFTLNGNFGGTNILLNTAPAKYLGDNGGDSTSTNPTTGATHTNSTTGWMWDFEPWTPTNIISITDDTDEVKLSIFNITTKSGISQTIEDIKVGEEYTASVYVYPKEGQTITMSTLGGTVTSTKTKVWEYLTLVFTAEENDKITFSASSDGFKFWHPKVEEGTVATTWGASPKDTVKAQERANAMFTQDNMWSILSNNGAMQGAWLINGNYYINASFISAGAIMSANWKTSGGTIADDGSITKYGTAGSAFSLKTGELHAAKFHLLAGTSGKLELNSDPVGASDPYLHVGDASNYITFTKNGTLVLKCEIFKLYTPSVYLSDEGEGSQTIADFTDVNPVLRLGSNFGVTSSGTLYAKGARISGSITATTLTTSNGTIGKWHIGEDSLYYGSSDESTATTKLDGSNGSISGATISGGSIKIQPSASSATSFEVNSSGQCTIKAVIIDTSLFMKGKMYIGPSTTSSWNFSTQTAQLRVDGSTILSGSTIVLDCSDTSTPGLWFSEKFGASGARLNTYGGKQIVMTAATGLWLTAEGSPYTAGGTGGHGIQITADAGSIYINGSKGVFIDATYIALGTGTAYTDYKITLPQPNEIYLPSLKKTLQTWVEEQNGIKIGGETNYYYEFDGTANYALALTPDGASDSPAATLKAPSSLPSSLPTGSSTVLALSNASTGTTVWKTMASALGAGYSNTGKFLKCTAVSSTDSSYSWVDLPTATASAYGTVKVHSVKTTAVTVNSAYTKDGRYYRVEMNNDGKLFVNVPWTDTNTTYSAGTGISIGSDNKISCTVSSGVSLDTMASSGSSRYVQGQSMVDTSDSPCYVAGIQNTGKTSVRKASFRIAAITPSSSRRFKKDINLLDYDVSNNLYKLQPVSFYYKDDDNGNTKRYGFIAEDVYEIMPELVDMDKGECSALYHNSILTLAVAEIQKLRKELDDLKSNLNI